MKKLILVLMAFLLMAGIGIAAEKMMTAKAGAYSVDLVFGKTPTINEQIPLTVIVKESGKAVTDAKVAVEYYMAEKTGPTKKYIEMPYHKSETATKAGATGYTGLADFSMKGRWTVKVKIEKEGKLSTASFHVNVK